MVFFPVLPDKAIMISQTSRMFAHVMLRKLLALQGAPTEYDPYIVTADSDLWPINHDIFKSNSSTDNSTVPDIQSLNDGCCGSFKLRSLKQILYPMTYVRMPLSKWVYMMMLDTGIGDARDFSPATIISVFRRDFGVLTEVPVTKGQTFGWSMDQRLLSHWINQYMRKNGHESVLFGKRTRHAPGLLDMA